MHDIRYWCDRCGDQVKAENDLLEVMVVANLKFSGHTIKSTTVPMQFCDPCVRSFGCFGWAKSKESEAKAKQLPPPKTLEDLFLDVLHPMVAAIVANEMANRS